ncbi:MAG: N-6 DNA methylase [Cyanobacteria bacterium SZAS-4]|nr:N-6 DNA methylase [Cyanobacteria bacterium SZAS-4]
MSQDSKSPPKFPSPEFVTCIILVALKILEVRNLLDRLGVEPSSLNSESLSLNPESSTVNSDPSSLNAVADLAQLVRHLHVSTNSVCPAEIRIPLNLEPNLNHSVISKALKHLNQTPYEIWLDDFALGYAYQFLSMVLRKKAQANIQTANKSLSQDDLIAFTQLYTPGWVVDFLVANSVLPQVQKPNFAPEVYESWNLSSTNNGKLSVEDCSILDPACGAGNFLVRAFDLVINLHLSAGWSAEQAVAMASSNIYGADIDPAALWITCLSLLVKSFQYSTKVPTNNFRVNKANHINVGASEDPDTLLGSLARTFPQNHVLGRTYSVVLMNPPYIGRKLMSRQLKASLKENYANSHSDISAAFIERSMELLNDGGRLGTITQASVLTLPSYGNLRKKLLNDVSLIACADAGTGVFPLQGGDKVNSAIIVMENSRPSARDSAFFDLRTSKNKCELLMEQTKLLKNSEPGTYFCHDQKIFLEEHESAIKYGCPSIILTMARQVPALADVADIRQGLATTNNERFVKKRDDVPTELVGTTWIPYVKGAGSDRWFSPVAHVVNWADDGKEIKDAVSTAYPYLKGNTKWVVKNEQFYFRPGLCFSFVNTGNLAVRKLPAGCIFDVGASAVFANDIADEDFLLAYLNSSFIAAIATSINPTINFQVGDVKRLPMFPFNQAQKQELAEIARKCFHISEEIHQGARQTVVLAGSKSLEQGHQPPLTEQLRALENRIDELVFSAVITSFDLSAAERSEIGRWLTLTTKR